MVRSAIAFVGAQFIYWLIWVFGRRVQPRAVPWLAGPLGGRTIGDRPYEETANAEGLKLERAAKQGGLIPVFDVLRSPTFDPHAVDPRIRDFYENTHAYRFDTWGTTYFPARIGLWLLVTTISRQVQQLNFPLDGLETAHGITSEVILLKAPDGSVRYTGWFRRMRRGGRVLYTGFYMTQTLPEGGPPCVKVVFPMPNGNATVLLCPRNDGGSGMRLESVGKRFGDAGFYRIQHSGEAYRVWRIASLHEHFHLYVDPDDVVRCDHHVRFLGFRVLTLHYRIDGAQPHR